MEAAAALVARIRADAGLSRRAVAARAGVPASTVSRIEAGRSDPTLTMLDRIAAAAGRRLELADRSLPSPSLAGLAERAISCPGRRVDWTRIRGLLDWLRERPDRVARAIDDPPPRTGDQRLDALLAGIAEKVADDADVARPRWCGAVPGLEKPWEAPGTPRMRAAAAAAVPPQLAARNIWLAERDLWRGRA